MSDSNRGIESAGSRFLSSCLKLLVAIGLLLAPWPLIASMMSAADAYMPTVLHRSTIALGERRTVLLPGHPIFIVHRTPEQIA